MSLSVKKTYVKAYLDAKTDTGREKRIAWMVLFCFLDFLSAEVSHKSPFFENFYQSLVFLRPLAVHSVIGKENVCKSIFRCQNGHGARKENCVDGRTA